MSLVNFIPEIWSARILGHLDKALVLAALANRNYEGEISSYGDTVKILSIGGITVADYTKATTITPQALSDQQTKLLIDQSKYFAFSVDDLDKAQLITSVMDTAIQRAAYALKDTADSFMAGLYTQAGTKVAAQNVAASNVIDWILKIGQTLDEANVPTDGRWLVLSPALSAKLVKARVITETANTTVLENGKVGRVLGFDIHKSNNLKVVSTYTQVLAGTTEAWTYAEQIAKVEGFRPEGKFADAVKGLHLYGAKVVQASALCKAPALAVAEE